MAAKMASRRCASCGATLARDNTASLCSPCRRVRQATAPRAPEMPAEFWQSAEIREAASRRDMGALLYAYRSHPTHGHRPLPQAVVSNWLGITQSQLSRLESGRNRVRELDKLEHYARVLGIPADVLWFEMPNQTPERHLRPTIGKALPSELQLPAHLVSSGPSVAESLLLTLQQYAATDNLAGSRSLVPVVPHQVKFIEELVGKSRGQGHTQLLYVAARFAEFAGWVNQDAGDLREAMRWSNAALDYAQEAEDCT